MLFKKDSVFSTLNLVVFQLAIVAAVCFTSSLDASAFNPQEESTPAAQAGTQSLDELLGQWKDLESELVRMEKEFKDATVPEQQDDLRGKYQALIDQANEMVGTIRTKAVEAFNASPADEKTARLLVGILKNDAEFNRNDDAIKLGDKLIAGGVDGTLFETAAKSDKISITTRELLEELFIRFNQHKMDDLPQVKIVTSKGDIVIELFEDDAPNTVANFISLVEKKFYNGLKFHRVIEGFVAQGGDPEGDGSGGPGYSIACECYEVEARRHYVGSLSMAHAGKDTGGSQFFICLTRTPNLNELHTVFGRVINGWDVLDRLSRNHTFAGEIPNSQTDIINSMEVLRKRDHEYKPVKIGDDSEKKAVEPPPAQPETMKNDPAESADESDADESDESDDDGDVEADSGSDESGTDSTEEGTGTEKGTAPEESNEGDESDDGDDG